MCTYVALAVCKSFPSTEAALKMYPLVDPTPSWMGQTEALRS